MLVDMAEFKINVLFCLTIVTFLSLTILNNIINSYKKAHVVLLTFNDLKSRNCQALNAPNDYNFQIRMIVTRLS